jgi:hypothetical protein
VSLDSAWLRTAEASFGHVNPGLHGRSRKRRCPTSLLPWTMPPGGRPKRARRSRRSRSILPPRLSHPPKTKDQGWPTARTQVRRVLAKYQEPRANSRFLNIKQEIPLSAVCRLVHPRCTPGKYARPMKITAITCDRARSRRFARPRSGAGNRPKSQFSIRPSGIGTRRLL